MCVYYLSILLLIFSLLAPIPSASVSALPLLFEFTIPKAIEWYNDLFVVPHCNRCARSRAFTHNLERAFLVQHGLHGAGDDSE